MAKPTYQDLRRTSAALYEYDCALERGETGGAERLGALAAFRVETSIFEPDIEAIRGHVLRAGFLCPKCDDYHFRAEDCCKCHGEGWTDDDVDTDCGPVATYAECGCQVCAAEAP